MGGPRACAASVVLGIALGACGPPELPPSPPVEKAPAPVTGTPAPAPAPAVPAPAPPAPKPQGQVLPILRDLAAWDAATPEERRTAAETAGPLLHKFTLSRMETFASGGASHEIAVWLHEPTGLEFSLIPAGTFRMGSPASETGRMADETQQTVTLTGPYLLCRTECTQAAWQRVLDDNPSQRKGDTLPVTTVNCYEAETFCSRARLTLPTEAQWEYACRAGTTSAYSMGAEPAALDGHAWTDDVKGTTHPVGELKPNAFGLLDVHGNVFEWCADGYGPRAGETATDPMREPGAADQRVVRGGSYASGRATARSAFRFRLHPGERQAGLGFRPARPVEWGKPRSK